MADALTPWLLAGATKWLAKEQDHSILLPKIAQLLRITRRGEDIVARLSDKSHFVSALLHPTALLAFEKSNPGRTLSKLVGGLIRVEEAIWRVYRDKTGHIQLVVHRFQYISGEGCGAHGQPRNLYVAPMVSDLLRRRLTAQKIAQEETESQRAGVDDLLHLVAPTQEQQYGGLATGSVVDDPLADICEIPQSQQEVLDKTAFYQEASCEISPANGPVVFPEPPKGGRLEDTRKEIDYFSSLTPTLWRVEYASWREADKSRLIAREQQR